MAVLQSYDVRMTRAGGPPPSDDPFDHPAMPEGVRALARRGRLQTFAKGRHLIVEGQVDDRLFIIASGRVRVYSSSDDSDREITYGTYGPGEYVGEFGLDGGPRAASVITLEKTLCSVIDRPVLERYIADSPSFAFELLAKVIRRARVATLSFRQMALNDAYGRLKYLLDSLAVPQGDGTRAIEERLTHKEIANRIGCTRERVSLLMKPLEMGDYLRVVEGRIVLFKALPPRY